MSDKLEHHKINLNRALSPEQLRLIRMVADAAAVRHVPLYLVGGFVRDLLLGIPGTDFDLVVEGAAIPFAQALAAQYGGRVTAHVRFGTAQWFLPGSGHRALDFISTRSETYKHPAALPTVKAGGLIDDLLRRDFTINTLAIRLDGGHWGLLRDELGGQADLNKGLVRVLNPQSFMDDPTRLFRAVRYEQRYRFQIVPETLSLMPEAKRLIDSLSAERLRHELDLILEEEQAVGMLDRLAGLGLLQPVHPALNWDAAARGRFHTGARMLRETHLKSIPASIDKSFLGWHFWTMDFALRNLESLEHRLHFHAKLFNSLLASSGLFAELPSMVGLKPSEWVRRLEELPLTAVYAVFLITPDQAVHQDLFNYLETWRHIKPETNGNDLLKLGLPPGPRFQQIIQRLREAWLDGEVKTKSEEMGLLEKLLTSAKIR
jgi:tRNA nucleotidyltransferase (CCA-adding enzyme)